MLEIKNIAIARTAQLLHRAKGRLRFSLFSGKVIDSKDIRIGQIIDALHAVAASNPALRAFVHTEACPSPETDRSPATRSFVSWDPDHGLTVDLGFVNSMQDALSWTAQKNDLFQSIGPDSGARFLLAIIAGGDILLSICASHLLMDGFSLAIFWEHLEAQILNPAPSRSEGSDQESNAFETITDGQRHHNSQPLSGRLPEQQYWQWIANQLRRMASDDQQIPFQKSCRSYNFGADSRFQKEYALFSNSNYTDYENYLAFFARLAFENTPTDTLHIQCPVSIRPKNRESTLGYFLDSRPLLIQRIDDQDGELHATVRSNLKRLIGLEIPWQDFAIHTHGLTAELLHRSQGITISQFFPESEFRIASKPCRPITEDDLKHPDNASHPLRVGQRSIMHMAPNCSYQITPPCIRVLSNINFIANYQ